MMFNDNKYTEWYFIIVISAKTKGRSRNSEISYEEHHIIPKCKSFNGNNTPENMVLLTFKEHFLVHWLLTKMCEGEFKAKMYYAFHAMSFDKGKAERNITSKKYELCRKYLIEANKIRKPPRGYKWSVEGRANLSKSLLGNTRRLGTSTTKEGKANMSKAAIGKVISEDTKLKMSRSKIGIKKSEETKQRMSNAQRCISNLACPHCNKEGHYAAMNRWHFNNCKQKAVTQ